MGGGREGIWKSKCLRRRDEEIKGTSEGEGGEREEEGECTSKIFKERDRRVRKQPQYR